MSSVFSASPVDVFLAPSIEFVKRKAKILRSHLEASGAPFPLAAIHQVVAKTYGANDWFDLEQRYKRGAFTASPLDDDLQEAQVSERISHQASALASLLNLPSDAARQAALQTRLTASASVHAPQVTGQWIVEGVDPGVGDFLLTVRPSCRSIVDGDMIHVKFSEMRPSGAVAPMHIVTGGFESGDRVYSRAFEKSPTEQQLADVLGGIRSILGERVRVMVVPTVDVKRYPLQPAARIAGVEFAHTAKGREAARIVGHFETTLCSLSMKSDQAFETFPTYEELDSLHRAPGHVAVTPRRTDDDRSPYRFGYITAAEQIADRVCRMRGRDPVEGARKKKGAPRNAPMNSHLGAAPAVDALSLALEATEHSEGGTDASGVEFFAQFLQAVVRGVPEDRGRAFDDLSEHLGYCTMSHLLGHPGASPWVNHWASEDLRRHLGMASEEALIVRQAMGHYLSTPRSLNGGRLHFQLFSLVVRQIVEGSAGGQMLYGTPDHNAVEGILRTSLGDQLAGLTLSPYFVSDYYKKPEWRHHMTFAGDTLARALRNGSPQAGQGPVSRDTLVRKKVDTVSPSRDLHLTGVVFTRYSSSVKPGTLLNWQRQRDLAEALGAASQVVNATLDRWGMKTRLEFVDVELYDKTCTPSTSLMKTLPGGGTTH